MLSFREQAAIAIWAKYSAERTGKAVANQAQELADGCCEKWGHQFTGEIHDESECERCGVKYIAIPPEES